MMLRGRLPIPPPRALPWALKPLASAKTTLEYDHSGRMVMRIEHDLLKGLTPDMLAWWFANIGGPIELNGARLDRYLAWHPSDHIHWALARPGSDGRASAGARFRIVEAFGADPANYIDVTETVTRLDASGFTAKTFVLGHEVSCLNHDFVAVAGGTRYLSTLTIGSAMPGLGRVFNLIVHRAIFSETMGRAWLKHNVEEVGALEHLIPRLIGAHAAGIP